MRSLWPREHGAYAQLAAPLIASLVTTPPAVTSIAFAVGACGAFLANEPLLVLLGHRGARMREARRDAARWRLAMTAGVAGLAAVVGAAFATRSALSFAVLAAIPVLVMVRLAWTRSVHSVVGELVAAVALPGAGAAVAVGAGAPWSVASLAWLAWSIGFSTSVILVHEVLRRDRRGVVRFALGAFALVLAGAATRVPTLWIATPVAIVAALLAVRPPPARRVRAIGVTFAIATAASAIIAVVLSR